MRISKTAEMNHEELFPNHKSTLKVTDPELIEVFDNFAFDEVLSYGKLDIKYTHEGSGLGHSEKDIAKLCPKATLLKGLAVHGTRVKDVKKDIVNWLDKPVCRFLSGKKAYSRSLSGKDVVPSVIMVSCSGGEIP